jgi:hypothetical protein
VLTYICIHLTADAYLVTLHGATYTCRQLGWGYGNRKVLYNTFSIWPRLDAGRLP